jgi:steroid 5-alpha reductase family enzyme
MLKYLLPVAGGKVSYLLPSLSVFACNSLMFLFCQAKKDNSYIDVWWGLSFIVPNAALIGLHRYVGHSIDPRTILINLIVSVWGMRLAWHIGKRHTEEDYRYKAMRERWEKKSMNYYYFAAFMYVFMMQALFGLVVNGAALYITANSPAIIASGAASLALTDYLGLGVAASGITIEALADW